MQPYEHNTNAPGIDVVAITAVSSVSDIVNSNREAASPKEQSRLCADSQHHLLE